MRNGFRLLRDGITALAILALLWLFAARLQSDSAVVAPGPYAVIDGDTLAAHGRRLRLLGLDAPELAQTCRIGDADWACGQSARAALKTLLSAADVECRGSGDDRYGRRLVRCVGGGRDLGAQMVQLGMAVSWHDYDPQQAAARQAGAGVWQGDFDLPSDWRHRKGLAAEVPVGSLIGRMRAALGLE